MSSIKIKNFTIDNDKPFTLIAGLNVLETKETTEEVISECVSVCKELEIPYIFKASYDKANRSSVDSYRGPGIKKGMQILSDLKHKYDVPIISDVHNEEEVEIAKDVLDIIQIPAFLCRQTDLVGSIARSGVPVNIKKAQFMSPADIKNVINKFACKEAINKAVKLMGKDGRLLVRKSGTEPKIRIMGESYDRSLILKCIKIIKKSIK